MVGSCVLHNFSIRSVYQETFTTTATKLYEEFVTTLRVFCTQMDTQTNRRTHRQKKEWLDRLILVYRTKTLVLKRYKKIPNWASLMNCITKDLCRPTITNDTSPCSLTDLIRQQQIFPNEANLTHVIESGSVSAW